MTTIEIRTRNMYSQLSNAEKLAADYLLHNMDHIFRYPLATLAKRSNTSQGAWVRFCKAIGFDGIKSLKNALFNEISATAAENDTAALPAYHITEIKNHADLSGMAQNICASSVLAINDTFKLLQKDTLKKAARYIHKAKRIALFGMYGSGIVANDLYDKLLRIGYPAVYSPDYHVNLAIASTLSPEDTAVIISYSGKTEEILRLASIASKQKAKTIAITRPATNTLTELCDVSLPVSSPQNDIRIGAMSSRIAQLFMTDILFSTVVSQNYENLEKPLEQTYLACKTSDDLFPF